MNESQLTEPGETQPGADRQPGEARTGEARTDDVRTGDVPTGETGPAACRRPGADRPAETPAARRPPFPPAVAAPAVLMGPDAVSARGASSGAVPETRQSGLLSRAAGLFERLAHRDAEGAEGVAAPGSGDLVLPAKAKLEPVARLDGQPEGTSYALVRKGLPLPPGSVAYLVEASDGAEPAPGSAVQVVALVDAYGRAFSVGGVQSMPPACEPDVQFKRYSDRSDGSGCVEVSMGRGRVARIAEYVERPESSFTIVGSRVDLGGNGADLPLVAAVAVSFLAFWLLPRKRGVSLETVGVREILNHLVTSNLFDAVRSFLDDAGRCERHPLLDPPGVVSYIAESMRDAGLEGLGPSDLAPEAEPSVLDQLFGPGVQGIQGLHIVGPVPFQAGDGGTGTIAAGIIELPAQGLSLSAPPVVSAGRHHRASSNVAGAAGHVGGDIASLVRSALRAAGVGGLSFLGAGGGAGPSEGPDVVLVRTSEYVNSFYVRFDRDRVSAEGARKLLEAESLLNRFVIMVEALDKAGVVQSATRGQAADLDAWVFDRVSDKAAPFLAGTVDLPRPETGGSGVDVRLSFSRGCESLRLPYRLEQSFRFDAASGAMVVDVECPVPDMMPRFVSDGAAGDLRESDPAWRNGMAARYALHMAGVVASVAFWAGEEVREVTVNCWHEGGGEAFDGLEGFDGLDGIDDPGASGDSVDPGDPGEPGGADGPGGPRGFDGFEDLADLLDIENLDDLDSLPGIFEVLPGDLFGARDLDCVASVSFEREAFEEALGAEGALEAFARDPFVLVEAAGGAFDLGPDWEMRAVDSLRDSDDPMFHPEGCDVPAELDEHAFDERRARILHAGRVKDLGIYEDGARKAMADEVLDAFERGGEQAALDALKDVHDRTENLYLRDACDTILGRVRAKTIDFGAKAQVVDALSDIYGLQAGMRAAQRTVQGNPLLACEQLDAMVGACDGSGLFADSATKKYRYFDSYASRALYAVRCPEAADGRELRLCADEYFLCHYRLASVLASSIERAEEAIAHARRCVELAPTVAASHLRLARCYFSVFDYRSEIDALRRMLDVVWNPADLGLALYWLGYAFFMVDDPAAGLACYQTCPVFDPSLSEPASAELADLLRKREMEPRPLPREECEAVFADRGIDLDGLKRNADALMLVAGAAVDAGSYGLARNLLASAQAVLRDDAAPAVIASLEP